MRELDGSSTGLKTSQIKRLEQTFRRKVKGDELVSVLLARHLCDLSHELHRQVGVLVSRGGDVERVIVGDPARLYLPDLGRARVGSGRLRGLRLVRTELRGQALSNEDLADLSKLRLDAVIAIDVDGAGSPGTVHWAHLQVVQEKASFGGAISTSIKPEPHVSPSVHELPEAGMALVRDAEAELTRFFAGDARDVARDTALLVGIHPAGRRARALADESMAELRQLARTAGVKVADEVIQIRASIDPKTVVGKGKIEELSLRALELGAEVLIFDRDLVPSQLRAITNSTDLKVIDRTQLILDIFARRATSRDGKVQVELAQLKYTLPRLIEKSTAMSRLTGGIGGQGPGETKLELHRRRARDRIHRLEQQIERLSVQRSVRRAARKRSGIPLVSIVGYTNAGKSTLLNAVTNASVLAEDKLFATLDPTSRRVRFPAEREIVLTDTVGFIRDLPKDLVNAFKATLEELEESDLILHVVDAADPKVDEKMRAVETILEELGVQDIPRVTVVNKIDATPALMISALKRATGGIPVSARDKIGLDEVMRRIEDTVFGHRLDVAREEAEARALAMAWDDAGPELDPELDAELDLADDEADEDDEDARGLELEDLEDLDAAEALED
jgi:GTP-binding protein HflX